VLADPGEVCAAGKNLVCIPERIKLKEWSEEKGKCTLCSKVEYDLSYDIHFRSVCAQFVPFIIKKKGTEQTTMDASESMMSRGIRTSL